MENRLDTANNQPTAPAEPKGWGDKWRALGRKITNNVDLINLYARGKDGYKIFEIFGPIIGQLFSWGVKGTKPENDESVLKIKAVMDKHADSRDAAAAKRLNLIDKLKSDQNLSNEDATPNSIYDNNDVRNALEAKDRYESMRNEQKKLHDAQVKALGTTYDYKNLKIGLVADLLNFALQWGISKFSTSSERDTVVRTYENLAREELGITNRAIKFDDLKRMKNPIVREAVDYYSKKSWYRSLPDFAGLVRLVPLAIFAAIPKLKDAKGFLSKALWTVAKKVDGVKLLLGAKTGYFAWYFTHRQTGSFYQAEELWNKTEGQINPENREVNQNTQAGNFVTQLEISTFYEEFRKENLNLKLAQYTPQDPLSSRIFDQAARYLNHHYVPDLYKISEPKKQDDLRDKNMTHAMLIELMGSGGLKVQDAMGSALRMEVMAYNGRYGEREAIDRYREVSKIIDKIERPDRANHVTQDELVEATYHYLKQIDKVGREYLGDFWPPKYIDNELKRGYITAVFKDREVSDEQITKMASALFMREQVKDRIPFSQEERFTEVFDRKQATKIEATEQPEPKSSAPKDLRVSHKKDNFIDALTKKGAKEILHPTTENIEKASSLRKGA